MTANRIHLRALALLALLPISTYACMPRALTETDEPGVGVRQDAIEAIDIVPETTYRVTLILRQPAGFTWTQGSLGGLGDNVWHEFQYNYTPSPEGNWLFVENGDLISWKMLGALGVKRNAEDWSAETCVLGDPQDLQKFGSNSNHTPCTELLPGSPSTPLSFGAVGAPLSRSFTLQQASDEITFGVELNNIGKDGVAAAANLVPRSIGFVQGISSGTSMLGSIVGLIPNGSVWAMALNLVSKATGYLAQGMKYLTRNPTGIELSQQACIGGMLGNPPAGVDMNGVPFSPDPVSALTAKLTGKELYAGTRNGPMTVVFNARMDYAPQSPPTKFGVCRAATDVILKIDRDWSNGLAFQSRSADSAVVRRPNAIDTFRANPSRSRAEHVHWWYADAWKDPAAVGLLQCNGPGGCAPDFISEFVDGVQTALTAPPFITNGTMPVTAVSPDPGQVDLYYVDDHGNLYNSHGAFSDARGPFNEVLPLKGFPSMDENWQPIEVETGDSAYWNTNVLASGLPANAHVAVLRVNRAGALNRLYWIGKDRLVHSAVNMGGTKDLLASSSLPGPAATPGASVAAVARNPLSADVFFVDPLGATVWYSRGPLAPSVSPVDPLAAQLDPEAAELARNVPWASAPIAPSMGGTGSTSPVTVVATTTKNLDVFYLDPANILKHVAWTTSYPVNTWTPDLALPLAQASWSVPPQLSSVSRTPNDITVVLPCNATGVCEVSVYRNEVPGVLPSILPPMPDLPLMASVPQLASGMPDGPISIVAATSTSLDIVSLSGARAFEESWQVGAMSWGQPGGLAFGAFEHWGDYATPTWIETSLSYLAPGALVTFQGDTTGMLDNWHGSCDLDGSVPPNGGRDAVYRLEILPFMGSTRVELDTVGNQFSNGGDTVLYILQGGNEVACNDDVAPQRRDSRLDLTLQPGVYLVVVDGHDVASHGKFDLHVRIH